MCRRLVDTAFLSKPLDGPRQIIHHQRGDSVVIEARLSLPNQTATGNRHTALLHQH
jgi:hypothetical protein